ncbi:hypothetical protein FN846DRAFT_981565 [Sphaerosporella brunnea]|uniref:Uncharacterized protein n=1 Tax=Sphaerosporella brunnea TaxID=1250544 RepID=A0A5J5ECP5_9PEZI|nr:hypothetical protein FN846DRAFT_981565 [Sphaerosporella brunnea]
MSLSIFNFAFGRALHRRPLSLQAIARFTSIANAPQQHCRQHRPVQVSRCTASRSYSGTAAACEPSSDQTSFAASADTSVCEPSTTPQETTQGGRRRPSELTSTASRAGGTGKKRRRRWLRLYAPELNNLLHELGVDIPKYRAGKTNLSHRNPLTEISERGRRQKPPDIPRIRRARFSLKEITTSFIYHCNKFRGFTTARGSGGTLKSATNPQPSHDPDLKVVKRVFTSVVLAYLRRRGCSPEDVMTWAWILTAPIGQMAGWRLEAALASDRKPLLPPFLITALLNRKNLPRTTLKALFLIIDVILSPQNGLRISDSKTAIVLAIRLLRHLRKTWPQELPRVVDFVDRALCKKNSEISAWVTQTYNRLLRLFSLPTADGPYRNAPLLQQCQFALVQQMVNLNAQITREGYRAIISVQIAHHKSFQEAKKVRNMSRGWPPWFEEKDGWIAAHRKAHEDVVAIGGKVIGQMMDAGYRLMDWEKEASVLAGKDSDGSPTIPTRTFWNKEMAGKWDSPEDSPRIWAARVRATRTIEEAWWHFRECMVRGVPHYSVWEEMFEKVIWAEKLRRKSFHEDKLKHAIQQTGYTLTREFWLLRNKLEQSSHVVPGDGKELIHPPLNPREGIFNSEPPPNVEDLFGMFLRSGFKPSHQLTAMLVSKAGKTSFAITVLQHWNPSQAECLLSPLGNISLPLSTAHPISSPTAVDKESVNTKVLAAFLSRLSRPRSLGKALRLIRHYRPVYLPAWNTVISGFVDSLRPSSPVAHLREQNIQLVWRLYNEMRALVDINAETLRLLAVAAERWTTLGLTPLWDGVNPVDRIAPIFFHQLGVDSSSETPAMIAPEPALLHAFVRALGFARRYQNLETLICFLDRKEWECGSAMARRVLIATRVMLEGAGYGVPVSDPLVSADGWKRLERLQPLVEKRWGGWGGERECEKYLILAGLVRGRKVGIPVLQEDEMAEVESAEDV